MMPGSDDDAFVSAVGPFLNRATTQQSGGHTRVLIKDTVHLSGLFLVQLLVKLSLQLGHKVILVPVEQSLDKYKAVLRRMGVQVQPLLDAGSLVVVQPPQAQQERGLQDLVVRICQACSALQGEVQPSAQAPVTIILDNVSDLHCLAESQEEWHSFVHYCTSLGVSNTQVPTTCILRVHNDSPDLERSVNLLEHAARAVIDVQPLQGPVADIHGQVVIGQRCSGVSGSKQAGSGPAGPLMLDTPLLVEQTLLFRSLDMGVKWISNLTAQHLLWA